MGICDCSSDVCSSDLATVYFAASLRLLLLVHAPSSLPNGHELQHGVLPRGQSLSTTQKPVKPRYRPGRAACFLHGCDGLANCEGATHPTLAAQTPFSFLLHQCNELANLAA